MRQSTFARTTRKEVSSDIESVNGQLLIRAGFVRQMMAGVYAYDTMGLRILTKIAAIVRKKMDESLEAQEILLPALHPKSDWQTTGRWDTLDVLMKVTSKTGAEYALGPTHEEQVVPFMKSVIHSYRDLPRAVYQIQTKFRDEPRAKSGLLRGREFLMKDLYSFHATEEDLDTYYNRVMTAYGEIFAHCELDALVTQASGGTFSKYSHEFQVLTPAGEDTIYYCTCKKFAQNDEIAELHENDRCPGCGEPIKKGRACEVGNIFKLNTKYSQPFRLEYVDREGRPHDVIMGCYGIGVSRLMGTIVEIHHDDKGIIWPMSVAPFAVHLMALGNDDNVREDAEELYKLLRREHVDVLYDDRDMRPGEKLSEADLLGLPIRIVVSKSTVADGVVELKERRKSNTDILRMTRDAALTAVRERLQ